MEDHRRTSADVAKLPEDERVARIRELFPAQRQVNVLATVVQVSRDGWKVLIETGDQQRVWVPISTVARDRP